MAQTPSCTASDPAVTAVITDANDTGGRTALAGDCAALLDAKTALEGTDPDRGILNWAANSSMTSWEGVVIGGRRVTELHLSNKLLTGIFPAVLSNLSGLTNLQFEVNELSGSLPDLSGLSNLETMNFGQNQLSGSLNASHFPTSIRSLYFSFNQLSGQIPDLNSLINLRNLRLGNNQLSGTIPDLSAFTELIRLSLNDNELTGSIPALNTLSKLQDVYLHRNKFTGSIPALSGMSNLSLLYLNNNNLTGPLPDLSASTRLQEVAFSDNPVGGTITASYFPTSVTKIYLHRAQLTGTIPDFSSFTRLNVLWLHQNMLAGSIPGTLGSIDLQQLLLGGNPLTGGIPSALGNLTGLTVLLLCGTDLDATLDSDDVLPDALETRRMGGQMTLYSCLRIEDASAMEGSSLEFAVEHDTYPVRGVAAATGGLVVDYETEDITAEGGVDYTASTGTATVPANTSTTSTSSTTTISVSTTTDSVAEGVEILTVNLTPPSGAVLTSKRTATGRISDAGTPSAGITFSPDPMRVLETGTGEYRAWLHTQPTADVTVALSKTGTDTAAATESTSSLEFPAGYWSEPETVLVTGVDDANANANRTLTLQHTASSSDTNYNGVSAGLRVDVDDAPEVEAFVDWDGDTRRLNRPNTIISTVGATPDPNMYPLHELSYVLRLSNRPEPGGTVTVTATVPADKANLVGLSLTSPPHREDTPAFSNWARNLPATLTVEFKDREPDDGNGCNNSFAFYEDDYFDKDGRLRSRNGLKSESYDGTADTPWSCWRKVSVVRKPASRNNPHTCADIIHTASGGGVRQVAADTIRAHIWDFKNRPSSHSETCAKLSGEPEPPQGAPSQAPAVQAPSDPVSNVQVTAIDDASATVSWDAVARATSYEVEWDGGSGSGTAGAATGITGTSTTIYHNATEAMTLTIQVIPAYVDGNGDTQLLNDLAGTATLDVGPAGTDSATHGATSPPPDYSDLIDDVRGYAAEEHHGQPHVDRWMRVLAAFGDDNGYEPMTAAEAQTMADTYSGDRWDPVVEALTELEARRVGPDPDPEVTVSAGGGVTEGTPASFTVTATPAPSAPLSVDVTVGQSGDFAAAGTTGTRTVTVPASGSVTLDIATVDDGTDEPDGSVSVTVDAGSGYTVGAGNTATVVVADGDDPEPEVTVSAGGGVTEGTAASFTVTASPAPSAPLDVDVSVGQSGDFATAGTTGSRTVTVPASGSVDLDIATVDDGADEPDGSVSVTVDAGSGYTVGGVNTATVAVADDDATPGDYSDLIDDVRGYAAEEQHGQDHVDRWMRVLAAFGDDNGYEPMTAAEAQIMADTYSSDRWDPVVAALTELEAARPEPEPEVTVSAGGGVTEGTPASFTVTATPAPSAPLDVDVTVGQSGDYAAAGTTGARTVTVPASGSATLDIATVDDGVDEPDGSVSVTVDAGTGYTVGGVNTATVAVADDDDPPTTIGACVSDDQWNTVEGYYASNSGKAPNYGRNWYRVLIAYGEERTDKTLPDWVGATEKPTTPYTVEEARISEGQWPGWRPMRKVLECLEAAAGKSAFVPLVPSASDPLRGGLVRIVNPGGEAGTVNIQATDDAGWSPAPVALRIGAGASVDLTSWDLEQGGAAKGLSGGVGSGTGDWRLDVVSDVAVRVLPYVRAADGSLAPMGEVVEADDEGAHRVPTFHPAGDRKGSGLLRLVNRGAEPLSVNIHGIDDAGRSPGDGVSLDIPASGSVALAAADLEGGAWLAGALRDGAGLWRLRIAAQGDLAVMNLLEGPDGRLSNLSGDAAAMAGERGAHVVPWLPSATDAAGGLGTLRVVNRSSEGGTVRIQPYDGAGRRHQPLTLSLAAGGAANLDAWDLELGNAAAGLSGGAGPGLGAWRLEVSSDLDVEVLAYVRRPTGAVEPLAGLEDRLERR